MIFTGNNFYGETDLDTYQTHGLGQYAAFVDTEQGRQILAAEFENTTSGTRVVLIGDKDFATNGAGLQTSPPDSAAFLYPDNVRLLINALAWLLNTGPVALSFPTPAPTTTGAPLAITRSNGNSPGPKASPSGRV